MVNSILRQILLPLRVTTVRELLLNGLEVEAIAVDMVERLTEEVSLQTGIFLFLISF